MKTTAIRIFVSSTFKDLQIEREMLVKGVFPKVKAYAESKGLSLYFVDLRWGITSYESLEIIKACLDEIDHCAPYFIGIVGNRYGYIPPDISGLDFDNIEQYKCKSITEMEMTYGVFNRIEKNKSVFAIKKDDELGKMINLNLIDSNEKEVCACVDKLKHLKEKTKTYCQTHHIPCYEDYTDVTKLCDFFYIELLKMVDDIVDDIGDPFQFKQTNYLNNSLEKVYKNNYMFEYIKMALNTNNKIVVYDENYSGKTTLLNHYFSLLENNIIINLSADPTLHNINSLYSYLGKKLNLNRYEIKYINDYLENYRGEKLYIVINDLNLINDIDNGDLLLQLPSNVSKDIVIAVSTNKNIQLSSLKVLDYYYIPHKSFDSFIFAEEQMQYECHKYGKDLSEDIRKFLRTSALCRDFSNAKVVLDYFVHESSIEAYSFIKECQTLEDFYYCLIDIVRSKTTFLSYMILIYLKIYEVPIDLDELYNLLDKTLGDGRKIVELDSFLFNKALNNIYSLVTYFDGKITFTNEIVKKALEKHIKKNSIEFYEQAKQILKYALGRKFSECAQNNIKLDKQEANSLYNHFFTFYYDLYLNKKMEYQELYSLILNEKIVKYIANNNFSFWVNHLKKIYNVIMNYTVKSKKDEFIILDLAKNKSFNNDELIFLYETLLNLSQYKEATEFKNNFNLITTNKTNFEKMFEMITITMNGSQLEYIPEMIKVLTFDKYEWYENKQILQKILLFYYYLEEIDLIKKYIDMYKNYVSSLDEITIFFEGYLETNNDIALEHFKTSKKIAERINNEEIELVSLYEIKHKELIARKININDFYNDITNILLSNQSLIMNCSHLAYKYYEYIITYCFKEYYNFNIWDDFTNKIYKVKNNNFQKIVKIMGEIAIHLFENNYEVNYYFVFNEIYDKNKLYEKLILTILKQLKNEKE